VPLEKVLAAKENEERVELAKRLVKFDDQRIDEEATRAVGYGVRAKELFKAAVYWRDANPPVPMDKAKVLTDLVISSVKIGEEQGFTRGEQAMLERIVGWMRSVGVIVEKKDPIQLATIIEQTFGGGK
jgi:hypothetical protein